MRSFAKESRESHVSNLATRKHQHLFADGLVAFGDAESFQQSSSSSASRNAQQELRTRQNTPLTMTHHYCFR